MIVSQQQQFLFTLVVMCFILMLVFALRQSSHKPQPQPERCTLCDDRPPDVKVLGRSAWTLMHTMAVTYPDKPSLQQQDKMRHFLSAVASFYPCRLCGTHLESYLREHPADVSSRRAFEQWLCTLHNSVNDKLKKPNFDCQRIPKRWGSIH